MIHMVKITKSEARKRLKECKGKLMFVALGESFPLSTFKDASKCMELLDKMMKVLK